MRVCVLPADRLHRLEIFVLRARKRKRKLVKEFVNTSLYRGEGISRSSESFVKPPKLILKFLIISSSTLTNFQKSQDISRKDQI